MLSLIVNDIQYFHKKYNKNPYIYIGLESIQKLYDTIRETSYVYEIEPKKKFKSGESCKLFGCEVIVGEFDFGYYFE